MRRLNLLCLFVLLLLVAGHFLKTDWDTGQERRTFYQRPHTFVQALQKNDLKRARALLQQQHDWDLLFAEMNTAHDARLYQRALDVQFEYHESSVPHERPTSYPERMNVTRKLVRLGARPTCKNLVDAIRQGKEKTAFFFLSRNVSTISADRQQCALTEAIAYSDIRLVRALLEKGSKANEIADEKYYRSRWCPLLAAANNENVEAVKVLLAHGADPLLVGTQNIPIWQTIRKHTTERYADGPPVYSGKMTTIWHLVKPVVEKRLGHSVPE